MRVRTCRIARVSSFGLALLAGIGHAPCVSAQESPPVPSPQLPVSRDSAPAPDADREADLVERLREMERTNRELAERLDAAQSRHDQQMKALLEQVAKLSKKVEGGGSGSGGRRIGRGRVERQYPRRERTQTEGDRAGTRRDARDPEFARPRAMGSRARAPRRSTR